MKNSFSGKKPWKMGLEVIRGRGGLLRFLGSCDTAFDNDGFRARRPGALIPTTRGPPCCNNAQRLECRVTIILHLKERHDRH